MVCDDDRVSDPTAELAEPTADPVEPNPELAEPTVGPVEPNPELAEPTVGPVEPNVRSAGRLDHLGAAAIALVLGVALAALAHEGVTTLLIGVAVVQAILIVSWVFGTALPGRLGGLVLGALASGAADAFVMHWPRGQLGTLIAVFALVMPAMFIHQLTRGVVRARVVESLSDIALMVICLVALAAHIQLAHETAGPRMATAVLIAAGASLVVGHLVDAAWDRPRFDPAVSRGLPALVLATVVGGFAGYLRLRGSIEFTTGRALLLCAATAAATGLFAIGADFVQHASTVPAGPARRFRPAFAVVIPLALVAPVGYLLCLAIRG
jgi:hypothetical protein